MRTMPSFGSWYVIAVAIVVYMLVSGATYSCFGLYVLPVSEEFGLSRADMNTALILFNIGNALTTPFVGWALDRVPAKRVMAACSALFAVSFVALGLSRSLGLSAGVILVPLAIASAGSGMVTTAMFIARWFEQFRGRALALGFMGISIGSIVIVPLTGQVIEQFGWRASLLITGISAGGLMFLLSFTLRERPRPGEGDFGRIKPPGDGPAPLPSSPPAGARPARVGEILRNSTFWLIVLPVGLTLAACQAIAISLVPIARGEGLPVLQATSLVSAAGIAGIAAKLSVAWLDGKLDRVWMLATVFALVGATNALLLLDTTYVALLASAVTFGFASGAIAPLYLAMLADHFGTASFGTVQGLLKPVTAILALIAVRLAGEVFDRTGGYDLLFAGFLAMQTISIAMIVMVRMAGGGRHRAMPTG